MFFGGEEESPKAKGRTMVLLDVENGSVASALVRLEPGIQPKLFGGMRKTLPLSQSPSADVLAQALAGAAREVMQHASTVAGRLRNASAGRGQFADIGVIERAELFLSPPWTTLEGKWRHERTVTDELRDVVEEFFGSVPASVHPFGRALSSVAGGLFPQEDILLSAVSGEVTELLLVHEGRVVSRATIPSGHHLLLRTLKSHGGLSEAEARSALRLEPDHVEESLAFAAAHFGRQFKDAAEDLLRGSQERSVSSVYIIAHEPMGEWFAKALSGEALGDIFAQGGVVRALRAHHLSPFIAAHAQPDLFLMLQAIFVDLRYSPVPV